MELFESTEQDKDTIKTNYDSDLGGFIETERQLEDNYKQAEELIEDLQEKGYSFQERWIRSSVFEDEKTHCYRISDGSQVAELLVEESSSGIEYHFRQE